MSFPKEERFVERVYAHHVEWHADADATHVSITRIGSPGRNPTYRAVVNGIPLQVYHRAETVGPLRERRFRSWGAAHRALRQAVRHMDTAIARSVNKEREGR